MGKPEWSEPDQRIERIYDLSFTSVNHRPQLLSSRFALSFWADFEYLAKTGVNEPGDDASEFWMP